MAGVRGAGPVPSAHMWLGPRRAGPTPLASAASLLGVQQSHGRSLGKARYSPPSSSWDISSTH